jgi:phospholipid/cholesterol/gamma-HCH transport system substrate-binding protein
MSARRILASAALVAALAAVSFVVLGGGGRGASYRLHFTHAGLLVKGADVLIGGQKVGSVTKLGLTGAGQADVTVEISHGTRRLHAGTTAALEEPSLSGQANRYIALNPGPNDAPALPDGAVIGSADTTSVVELDELYNLLDPPTRDGLRHLIRGERDAWAGRSADGRRFFETFAPAVQASDRLFRELSGDGRSLERFLAAGSQLARTLRTNSDDLYGAVQESARATAGFANASTPLERAIRAMPAAFAQGRRGLAQVRAALPELKMLVARAHSQLKDLPAFAGSLTTTLHDERSLSKLAALLASPGASDDLVEAIRFLPPLRDRALPSFRSGAVALRDSLPLVDQLRPYVPDVLAAWGNTGRAMADYDANGHYARVLPQFGAFAETADGSALRPVAPSERILGLTDGLLRRCPGTAGGGRATAVVAGCEAGGT